MTSGHQRFENIDVGNSVFYNALCWFIALGLHILFQLLRHSCRIRLTGSISDNEGVIEAFWHQSLPLYFICCPFNQTKRFIWLQHPAWYMKSIHLLLERNNVKIALGSSGRNGTKAMQSVIHHLQNGYSTTITPDGPKGPPKKLKKGIINMAMEAQCPIQIIRFSCSSAFQLPTWDKKIIPLPFSTITVEYCPPIDKSLKNKSELLLQVEEYLHDGDFYAPTIS